jgi:sphingomyelin phosphodiesterase
MREEGGEMIKIFIFCCILLALCAGVESGRRDSCSTPGDKRIDLLKLQQSARLGINATCIECELAVLLTREYISTHNKTQSDISDVIEFFCVVLKIEDRHVCADIVVEYSGLIFYLIADKTLTSAFACGVIGLCPKVEFPKWNVTLSPTPPPIPYPAPNPKNPSMYVLHITDIHVDPLYTPGLLSKCGEPICCRPPNPVGSPAAGQWGDYNCDLSPALYENMLMWIAKNLPNINYTIFTGDMPPHDVWDINRTTALSADTYVIDTYTKYLPDVPMFPAMGNHEAVPVNVFAPHSVTGPWNMSWLYGGLAERWERWLPTAALAKVDTYGYYSTATMDGVRMISLNTNSGCNNLNWFLSFPSRESADPDGQLQWLADTLGSAEKDGEKVYIIKHIAPSKDECGVEWWRNYLNIIDRYKNIIMGDFAGHTHDDIFTVSYKLDNNTSLRPIYTTFFPGSVTPYSDENPGFRVYEIDSVTKAVIDYTQYAINLTRANEIGFPTWQPIYSARSAYSLADMSPPAWHDLSLRMGGNQTLLYQYWARTGKYSFAKSCDASCMHNLWCALWNPPPDTSRNICGI